MRFSSLLLASLATLAIASPTPKDSASLENRSPEELELDGGSFLKAGDSAERHSGLRRRQDIPLTKLHYSNVTAEDYKDDEEEFDKRSPAKDPWTEMKQQVKKCYKKSAYIPMGAHTYSAVGPMTFTNALFEFCQSADEGLVLPAGGGAVETVEEGPRVKMSDGKLGFIHRMWQFCNPSILAAC